MTTDTEISDTLRYLYYRVVRHYLGFMKSVHNKKNLRKLWRDTPASERICCFCGKHIAIDDRSIDHIIPKSICYELNLYKLLFDIRNLRLTHRDCNTLRSSDITDLPDSVVDKLIEIRAKTH